MSRKNHQDHNSLCTSYHCICHFYDIFMRKSTPPPVPLATLHVQERSLKNSHNKHFLANVTLTFMNALLHLSGSCRANRLGRPANMSRRRLTLLLVVFSACGGICTNRTLSPLTAYFLVLAWGTCRGKGGLFVAPRRLPCFTGLKNSSTQAGTGYAVGSSMADCQALTSPLKFGSLP